MYMGVQLKSELPTHWNLIGPSMTAQMPALSPSNILPPPSSHRTRFKMLFLQNFFALYLELRKSEIAQFADCL
jgi:hypothetical protein